VSWADLRAQVSAANSAPAAAAPTEDPATAAREAALATLFAASPLPPEAEAAAREALTRHGASAGVATPETVPVLPLRNAVAFPGAVYPIDVSRTPSVCALEAALATQPAFLAIFSQRAAETEQPSRADLHEIGCLCVVLYFHRGAPKGWALIEGVRWVTLESLDQTAPYYAARVADSKGIERGPDDEIAALDVRLRDTARKVAETMPQAREAALALINDTTDIGTLADIVMANFPQPVADTASYAAETELRRRLQRTIALLESELAKAQAAQLPG
jgi:ATP-dependent Lon protease